MPSKKRPSTAYNRVRKDGVVITVRSAILLSVKNNCIDFIHTSRFMVVHFNNVVTVDAEEWLQEVLMVASETRQELGNRTMYAYNTYRQSYEPLFTSTMQSSGSFMHLLDF